MSVFFLQISLYWLVLSLLVVLGLGILGAIIYRSFGAYHRLRTPIPPNPENLVPIPPRPKPAWMVEDGYVEHLDERGCFIGYRRLERDENGAEVVRYYDEDGNRM
jgi:hypothetical protein